MNLSAVPPRRFVFRSRREPGAGRPAGSVASLEVIKAIGGSAAQRATAD
jgi:hypothetical protein